MIDRIKQIFMGTSTTPRSTGAYVVREERVDPNKTFFEKKQQEEARAAENRVREKLDSDRRRAENDAYQKRQEENRKFHEQRGQNSGGSGGGYKPPGGSGGGAGPDPSLQAIFKASNRQFAPDVRLDNRIFKHGTPYDMALAVQSEISKVAKREFRNEFMLPHKDYVSPRDANRLGEEHHKIKEKKLEIDVALYVGPQLREIDNWVTNNGPTRQVDVGTKNAIIEVTVSDKGKAGQINRHISYDTAQRSVVLYAPNYTENAARSVKALGGHVVRNPTELADVLQKLTKG